MHQLHAHHSLVLYRIIECLSRLNNMKSGIIRMKEVSLKDIHFDPWLCVQLVSGLTKNKEKLQ